MLISDLHKIGDRLYRFRKKAGLTQNEVAERAEISDRTYADIERGSVNMRTDTMVKICKVLDITPNDLFYDGISPLIRKQEELFAGISECSEKEQETALAILSVYLESVQ